VTEQVDTVPVPPPLPPGGLRVIPLGGLGAIGRNMTLFEFRGKLLIVDCGVLFPDVDQPGVDLILPDFSSILDRLDDVQAIVLTTATRTTSGRCRTCSSTSGTSAGRAPSSRWPWSRRSWPSGASSRTR
jgi:hypothetical protein